MITNRSITSKDLQQAVNVLNNIAGMPQEPYGEGRDKHGHRVPNVGNFSLCAAYGGWKLVQMVDGGGERDVFTCGYTTRRNLYNLINAYASGIEYAQ